MGRLVGLLVLAAACSPAHGTASDATVDTSVTDGGIDPNDGARSGSRLKLTWFDFTDGTRQWYGFYDAERKEHCSIYGWTGGKYYCAPDADSGIVYTNATCTNAVDQYYLDPSCTGVTPPGYVVAYSSDGCTTEYTHLYPRGAKTTVANYYYKSSDGSCGGPYSTAGDGETYYTLGTEIPTTQLVELTEGSPTSASRLSERFFQSADGMQFPAAIHDAMLGADCSPSPYTETTASCTPDAWYAGYDHDAACMQPEIDVPKTCAMQQFIAVTPATACPADPSSYYTVGAALPSSPLYYASGTTCTATTGAATENYFGVGQPIALAPLARTPDTAVSHRIQLIHYTTPDGLLFRAEEVYDDQEGADCYPTQLPDGTIRCVVYGGYTSSYFSNATCTTAIDLVELSTGPAACGAPEVPKFARKYIAPVDGTCNYTTEVHPIGAAHAGTVYTNYGTCTAYVPSQTKLYDVGAAVPLTDFVSAVIVNDP